MRPQSALTCILVFLRFLSLGGADDPVASDSSVLTLAHRDLLQFDLANVVLLSLLDGSLQARTRDSGQVLWTLEGSSLVVVQATAQSSANPSQEPRMTWLAEPSEQGNLFYFTPDGGIERIPASVAGLVQKSPFGVVGNVVYTGSKRTTLYALDILTGEVIQAFGETLELSQRPRKTDPSGIVMIGRTEYSLDIHEHLGSPGWRIKIGMWTPNTRDQDLTSQYSSPLDSVYLAPLSNTSVMALAENDMRPQRWIGETSSLLINVFDVLKSKSDGHLSLVQQPPLKLSGMSTDWDLFVTSANEGVPVIVSGSRYAALFGSAPLADFCSGKGNGIFGVHPLWCQDKRRSTNKAPPAISLLPPATSSLPAYPLLDPPVEPERSQEPSKGWPLIKQVLEIIGMVVIFLGISAALASQGWLPVDIIGLLQRFIGTASRKQSLKASGEEPKRRKRGVRGGKKNNNSNNSGTIKGNTTLGGSIPSADTTHGNKVDGKGISDEKEKDLDTRVSASAIKDSPIAISDVVLGYGSHGTTVFKGRFENRDVAVKRMLLEFYDVASQEVDILRESDDHPNVIRYYCKHETEQFLYIALELCPGTLEDMVRASHQFSVMYDPLDAVRQVTLGLQHLHNLQIVHRDIKPQNILVALPSGKTRNRKPAFETLGVRYLISDFGLCRKLEGEQSSFLPTFEDSVAGTAGWAAPEISNKNSQQSSRLTRAVDIFSMGCLYYYVLSGGKHPFGDAHMRQVNIQTRVLPVLKLGGLVNQEALDLIPQMLDVDPHKRPNTMQILKHPLFWTDQLKLDFLVKVSDRLEHDSREEHSGLIDRLEINAHKVVGNDWHTRFPKPFLENLGKYRRYHGDRILDLLRALRNKLHHFNDYTEDLKKCVGSPPSDYLEFFTSRFPHLLVAVYHFAQAEFKDESAFSAFF